MLSGVVAAGLAILVALNARLKADPHPAPGAKPSA
jgi:hypothetical protein